MLKYNGNWAFIQRLYAVRDERAARKVAYLSGVLFFVAPVICRKSGAGNRCVMETMRSSLPWRARDHEGDRAIAWT